MSHLLDMRRIPMDGIYNFRSLGGYAAGEEKDRITKHGVLYRSARPHELSKADEEKFHALKIKTVIDLRSDWENESYPDDFLEGTDVLYCNIDVMPQLDPEKIEQMSAKSDGKGMASFYMALLDTRKEKLAEVFHQIVKGVENGAVLFHCSVGRDRTGVVAALLLLLSGVDAKDIVADYQISETYLEGMIEETLYTPFSNMVSFIEYVEKNYGDVFQYMEEIGVSKEEVATIQEAFTA